MVNIFRSRSLQLQFAPWKSRRGRGRRGKRAVEVIFANITRSRESCDALRENDSVLHKKRSAWRAASRRVALRRAGRVMRINKTRNKHGDEGGRGRVELCTRDKAQPLAYMGDWHGKSFVGRESAVKSVPQKNDDGLIATKRALYFYWDW